MHVVDIEIIDIKDKLKKVIRRCASYPIDVGISEREAVILLKALEQFMKKTITSPTPLGMPNIELEGEIVRFHYETIDGKEVRVIDEFIMKNAFLKAENEIDLAAIKERKDDESIPLEDALEGLEL